MAPPPEPPPEMTAVGTYPSAEEAEGVRARLADAGIESAEVRQLSSASWQVEASPSQREHALEELQRMEQHIIPDSW